MGGLEGQNSTICEPEVPAHHLKSDKGGHDCAVYMHLCAGWLLITVLTFMMASIPNSAQFLDIEPSIDWESGHEESDRYIVYGLWVLVEIALFFVLLVITMIVVCSHMNVYHGAGLFNIIVDPAIVTLISVPFILIRGLPRASTLQSCLTNSPNPIKYYTVANNNLTNIALGMGIGTGVQCLLALPYELPINMTVLDANGKLPYQTETVIEKDLQGWITLLQCAVITPAIIRFVHFRWKMSWNLFIYSNTYFFIQSIDGASLVMLSTNVHTDTWNIICQIVTYMASLGLCLGSLTLAIPPIYLGNRVTGKYIKWSTYIGTILIDIPFLILRIYSINHNGITVDSDLDGIFCAMIFKEMACIFGCICILFKKLSNCIGSTYLSLSLQDPDLEEYEMNGIEEYL